MRLGIDATPLLGRRTGVGRYVAGLLQGLRELEGGAGDPPLLAAFTWRGGEQIPAETGLPRTGRRVPARALWACWRHSPLPRLEWLGVRCDVFHATNFVLPPSRRSAGVVTVHDLGYALHTDTVEPHVAAFRSLVPRGLARAAVVLTVTEALADEVADHYHLDRERVRCTPNGIDEAWLHTERPSAQWLRAHGLPERYLVFVGTLEPRKNISVLLEAVRLLGPDAPPLVLAGSAGWGTPPDLASLPPGRVHRLGFVQAEVLRGVVAGAACLVFPSRHEGFGLPPLEALAAGTPVVSSDLPALREVTGPYASYAPVGDAAALAEAVSRVLADTDGEPDSARQARRAHAATWTWRRCAQAAVEAYRLAAS